MLQTVAYSAYGGYGLHSRITSLDQWLCLKFVICSIFYFSCFHQCWFHIYSYRVHWTKMWPKLHTFKLRSTNIYIDTHTYTHTERMYSVQSTYPTNRHVSVHFQIENYPQAYLWFSIKFTDGNPSIWYLFSNRNEMGVSVPWRGWRMKDSEIEWERVRQSEKERKRGGDLKKKI